MPRCYNCGIQITFRRFADGYTRAINPRILPYIEVHSCPRPQELPPKFTPAEEDFLEQIKCTLCSAWIRKIPKIPLSPLEDDYYAVKSEGVEHHDCQDLFLGTDSALEGYIKENSKGYWQILPIHCIRQIPRDSGDPEAVISIINHYDKCVIADRYSIASNSLVFREPKAGELILFNSPCAESFIHLTYNGGVQVWIRQNGNIDTAIENLYINREFGYSTRHRFKCGNYEYKFV